MRTPQWTHAAARPFLLQTIVSTISVALLVSCSVPDGPDTVETTTPPSPDAVEASESVDMPITLNGPGQLLPVSATADIKGLVFELEVARTAEQQALGLMFRSELPDNRGMLFPFESPRRANFWMKDVPVPLDMVFLRNREVIAIAASVPPCPAMPCPSYGPGNQIVDMVLELRSGRAAEIGLQEGDSVVVNALPAEAP